MFFVYVLRSEKNGGRFYVGMTQSVDIRLKQHNLGAVFSTKGYRPWSLFFVEIHITRIQARLREKYLKGGSGRELIRNKWLQLKLDTCLPAGREQLPSKQ